jgi:integrase
VVSSPAELCKKAGISDLRIHDLRHFATTMLFMEGIPDTIIRKMTGDGRQLELPDDDN